MLNERKKAIFLDRDGTINVDKDYLYKIEDFQFEPKADEALKILYDLGYILIIVTNQSGIARGYYSEEDVEILHQDLSKILQEKGIEEFNIDTSLSYMVGDKKSDVDAGLKAGVTSIFLNNGKEEIPKDLSENVLVFKSLYDFAIFLKNK